MRRLDRRDCAILLSAGIVFAAAVLAYTHFEYAFGSILDWPSQHYAIPDMMRKLFYDTGELFPSLAPDLGAGENIYAFSYYGLYSPVILFSYLLPFVPMRVYIQVSAAVLCFAGAALFYRFMRKRSGKAVSGALMAAYLLASPVFLHSHRHIMFVSCLPFLILAFEAVDMYFEGRHRWQLTLWSFLIIMTSWFFSVAALTAVTVYGVYRWLSVEEEPSLRAFLRAAGGFAGRIVSAVLMAGVLLLPTIYVLISGRDEANITVTLKDFIPSPRFNMLGYSAYSMGLGTAALFGIVCGVLSKDRARRFLGIVMALLISCPLFVYILNGTMYIDSKVLIPFIPLTLLLFGDVLADAGRGAVKWYSLLITAGAFWLCWVMSRYDSFVFSMMRTDMLLLAAAVVFLLIFKNRLLMFAALLAVPFCSAYYLNSRDQLISEETLDSVNSPAYGRLTEKAESEGDWLRTSVAEHRLLTSNLAEGSGYRSPYLYSSVHNKLYNSFYLNVMNNENELRNPALTVRSQNPMFELFISNGRLLSESPEAPYGYEPAGEDSGICLYTNPYTLPVGRVKPRLGEDVFDSLTTAEKMEALVRYTVSGSGGEFESTATPLGELSLPESQFITRTEKGYSINAPQVFSLTLPLEAAVPEGKLLVLETVCGGNSADVSLTVNGVTNLLTDPNWKYRNNNTSFTYVIAPGADGSLDALYLDFSEGEYTLSSFTASLIDYPAEAHNCDALVIDRDKTGGDVIEGSITCTGDGMFELAVPYSEGFTLTVDGQEREYECVGKAFIGFPLEAGEHSITLRFTAPWLRAGQIMSILGLLTAVLQEVLSRRRKG
ncbi:MAG: YfhO family protein [Ruminococcus sp.]|nr:YfhO family protein [Ruminococcus sp.]